jgi:hypothetical protein
MTAQVIFLNTMYFPDEEEQHELDKMQELLTFCHAQFEFECRTLSDAEKWIRKERVHRKARERMGIVRVKD